MGFIRLSSFRNIEDRCESEAIVRNAKTSSKTTEDESVREQHAPPEGHTIVKRTTRSESLPFIPASSVQLQDGSGSNRLWIVVDNTVLDVSEYVRRHPGGRQIIQGFGGQDCTWQWWTLHGKHIWERTAKSLCIGRTEDVQNKHERPEPAVRLPKLGYQDWD